MVAGDIIVGIDIGSSKVCTVVGQVNESNGINVLGMGTSAHNGIKKGIIIDIDSTANAIKNSVNQVENKVNVKINSAYVNIIGMHLSIAKGHGAIDITGDKKEITEKDIERVLFSSQLHDIGEGRQVIDIIPRQYIVDGYDSIVDPFGMVGGKLEVDANIVTGTQTSVQNIIKSVERAGLKIDGLIVESMASSEVLLSQYEKDIGAALIDVGAGVTDISIFTGSNLAYYNSIPVGGDHITNDIAIGLKIPYNEAERLKRQCAIATTSLIKNDQEVFISSVSEKGKMVKVSEVVAIIEARIQEILYLALSVIEKSGYRDSINAGVVLAGGGVSYIDGSAAVASETMNLPARCANVKVPGLPGTEFLTAYGIIKYVTNSKRRNMTGSQAKINIQKGSDNVSHLWQKFSTAVSEFFNM